MFENFELRKTLLYTAPVMELQDVEEHGIRRQKVSYLNNAVDWGEEKAPYLKDVDACLCRGLGRRSMTAISCESRRTAWKAATYLLNLIGAEEIEPLDYYWDYQDEDDPEAELLESMSEGILPIYHIDLSDLEKSSFKEKLHPAQYQQFTGVIEDEDMLIISGISEEIAKSGWLSAICARQCAYRVVIFEPEQLKQPWARHFLFENGCSTLTVREPGMDYYGGVCQKLLPARGKKEKAQTEKIRSYILRCRQEAGDAFGEEYLAWGMNEGGLWEECKEVGAMQRLQDMTGLDEVKQVAERLVAVAREQEATGCHRQTHRHLIFSGSPGTGKTTAARLLAEILAQEGVCKGAFTDASRSDIIAQYVGQTAPKVAGLFQKSRNGILFVDEAGFFLSDCGGYGQEAMKEFVRYMELYPDVTVIFALYSNEVDRFLELDAGLASRIGNIVRFQDYGTQELGTITERMLEEWGYHITKAGRDIIKNYFVNIQGKERAGNARGARKLADEAVAELSLSKYRNTARKQDTISVENLRNAVAKLQGELAEKKIEFGFVSGKKEEFAWSSIR